jgi:RNA polymerase sigma factor (sigma-70 family)
MKQHPLPARPDLLLAALLDAETAAAREEEIERLVVGVARPLVARIVGRHARTDGNLRPADADDVMATVSLRLVVRLRALVEGEDDVIEDFERYVSSLTYNALNDLQRSRFPERARLKTRLRYILTHDRRLALWSSASGAVAGLAAWSGSATARDVHLHPSSVTAAMRDSRRTADALAAIFATIRQPLTLDALVLLTAELWNIADVSITGDPSAVPDAQPQPLEAMESREFLRVLWREIRELRPLQRKALLLNLRDSETVNVVALLVVTGTASFDELAAAIDMSAADLAAIWNDLPLDDLRIAELLGLTRQQVINLRKSARERLARRALRGRA